MSKVFVFAVIALLCGLQCIEALPDEISDKFRREEIVPDVLEVVPELKLLKISYPSGVEVNLGNVLTPTEVKDQPTVELELEDGSFYTLLMTDPDAPSRKEPTKREFRHWLVVNIPGSDLSKGETFFEYIGSGPPQGTGLHRYIFLLFKQKTGKIVFDSVLVPNDSALNRPATSTRELIRKYDLELLAGNFYQAEYDDYVPTLHAKFAKKQMKTSTKTKA